MGFFLFIFGLYDPIVKIEKIIDVAESVTV